ncbi:MAG: GIY-YIG nuclease family protein [Bacteroidetes bacterium]|nr:GIY-YIG nuclease family protein [Bacteroidota bacterium]
MSSEPILACPCVYIIKTGGHLYKIGKTRDLQKRLASYHTHLPILFRVVRQYPAANMEDLEASLHIVFQHKRVKGEWFQLKNDDLQICDNIARNYALEKLQRQSKATPSYSQNPVLQVMEANEKYLRDYSRIAEDIKLGLSVQEIVELHEGNVSKATIATVRKLLHYQTPNSEFLSQWFDVVNDLEAGATEDEILQKNGGEINRTTIHMIKRILRNQLF